MGWTFLLVGGRVLFVVGGCCGSRSCVVDMWVIFQYGNKSVSSVGVYTAEVQSEV